MKKYKVKTEITKTKYYETEAESPEEAKSIVSKKDDVKSVLAAEEILYVVRLYDGFDNIWVDICKPCTREDAQKIWDEKTNNGTRNTNYGDIDYYKIYPSNTKMIYS